MAGKPIPFLQGMEGEGDIVGEALEMLLKKTEEIGAVLQRLDARPYETDDVQLQSIQREIGTLRDAIQRPMAIEHIQLKHPLLISAQYTLIFLLGIGLTWGTLRWWPVHWMPPGFTVVKQYSHGGKK